MFEFLHISKTCVYKYQLQSSIASMSGAPAQPAPQQWCSMQSMSHFELSLQLRMLCVFPIIDVHTFSGSIFKVSKVVSLGVLQVLGRVRRLLSVQEPLDLRPPRPAFKRHSSDATGSFFPDFRFSAASPDGRLSVRPSSSSSSHPGPKATDLRSAAVDTLREVSAPPPPRRPASTGFPRLVVSPPLSGDDVDSSGAKRHNGLDSSPSEAPGPWR